MNKLLLPALIFLIAAVSILYTHRSYEKSVSERIAYEYIVSNRELSQNIEQLIQSRVDALHMLSSFLEGQAPKNEQLFDRKAEAIYQTIPGLYAVNWIDPQGIIRYTHPDAPNKAARGRNVREHPAVKQILQDSFETRSPKMSGRLTTFQGITAFVLYVPLIHGNQFNGWVNTVVDYRNWLDQYFSRKGIPHLSVELWIKGDLEPVYRYGNPLEKTIAPEFDFTILNQSFTLKSSFSQNAGLVKRQALARLVRTFLLILLVIAAFLHFLLLRKMKELEDANQNLRMSRAIVSSLTHDITSPLTTLQFSLFQIAKAIESTNRHLRRAMTAIESMGRIVSSMKRLHLLGLNTNSIGVEPVALRPALEDAIDLLKAACEDKSIRFRMDLSSDTLTILAEESSLVHHVLVNALQNAVKFSPPDSEIGIRARETDRWITVEINDRGEGIPQEHMRTLFKLDRNPTTRGTAGERGSGLGLIQIKTFMDLFGGKVSLRSKPAHGTTLQLDFRKA